MKLCIISGSTGSSSANTLVSIDENLANSTQGASGVREQGQDDGSLGDLDVAETGSMAQAGRRPGAGVDHDLVAVNKDEKVGSDSHRSQEGGRD